MLMSQLTLSSLLGISEQELRRWEHGKIKISKPSESLLRLIYKEYTNDKSRKIVNTLKEIANLEEKISEIQLVFQDTENGWKTAA